MRTRLGTRSRGGAYLLLVGVVAGMLGAGLAVPLIFGDSQSGGPSEALTAGGEATEAGPLEQGAGDAVAQVGSADAGPAATGTTSVGGAHGVSGARSAGATAGAGATGPAAGSGGVSATATTVAAQPGGLTATDRGVTATTIKVGIPLLSVETVNRLGVTVLGVDPDQQKRTWEAYIPELNRRGGILGRKVEPYYQTVDVFMEESMRVACQAFANDGKVFAVLDLGAIFGAPVLCFTEQHQLLLLTTGSQGMAKEFYPRSRGLLYSLFPSGVRAMANLVGDLDRSGLLKGRTIGILSSAREDPSGGTVEDGTIATLGKLGYQVAHHARLSHDLATQQSQVPVEVQQMKTKGVDAVFLFTGNVTTQAFVQNADGQAWYPKYFAGDWASGYSDTYVQNMPQSFEGNIAITTNRTGEFRTNRPEPQYDATCRQRFEKASGRKIPRTTPDESIVYNTTVRICTLLDIFEKAAIAAGPTLNRARLGAAILGLGQIPMATWGGGSFRPGKYDAADLVRTIRFEYACKCWKPVDDFRSPRF